MKKRLEETLIDALSYCSLRELPSPENGVDVWIRAIAKVAKNDGTFAYVYMEKNTETLENKIKKDFGTIGAIVKVLECYPFSYLDSKYMPIFKNNSKEERISYLSRVRRDKDFSKMTLKELNREVVKMAIIAQLENEKRQQEIFS